MTAASIALATAATACKLMPEVRVRRLGRTEYIPTWHAMQEFTAQRAGDTADELWLTEHPPAYTLGVAGRAAHLPRVANDIPVIKVDRGGQITYHGPGQIVLYVLLDLRRRNLSVRPLVRLMEDAVIDLLAAYGIAAAGRIEAPGVYVNGAKVAALGLRIRDGRSYHGLAVNVDMDLSPFYVIDPCGYSGLTVTQARDLGIAASQELLADKLVHLLLEKLA